MNGILIAAATISVSLLAMWTIEYRISKSRAARVLLKKHQISVAAVLTALILLIPAITWVLFRARADYWGVVRIFIGSLLLSVGVALLLRLLEYLVVKNMLEKPYQEYTGADTQPFIGWVASETVSRIGHETTKAVTFRVIHSQGSQKQEIDAISREINLLMETVD